MDAMCVTVQICSDVPTALRVRLPQADQLSTEHQVVAAVWSMIQDILSSGEVAAQEVIRSAVVLIIMMPAVEGC